MEAVFWRQIELAISLFVPIAASKPTTELILGPKLALILDLDLGLELVLVLVLKLDPLITGLFYLVELLRYGERLSHRSSHWQCR